MVLAFHTSSVAFALCFHALLLNGFASHSIAASTGLGFISGSRESLRSLVGFRNFLGSCLAQDASQVCSCAAAFMLRFAFSA